MNGTKIEQYSTVDSFCGHHSVDPGSNPKHTIFAFPTYSQILYYICH